MLPRYSFKEIGSLISRIAFLCCRLSHCDDRLHSPSNWRRAGVRSLRDPFNVRISSRSGSCTFAVSSRARSPLYESIFILSPKFLPNRSDGSAIQHLQGMRKHNSLLYLDMLRIELLQLSRLGQ